MQYASFTFLFLFLPITLGIYALTPQAKKPYVMLGISVFSLLFGGVFSALIELFLTLGLFGAGILLEHCRKQGRKKSGRLFLCGFIILCLAVCLFLRSDFVQSYSGSWWTGTDFFPLGLSFFTLQCVGYCLDVWQAKIAAERCPWRLFLYMLFFPCHLMGPVLSYEEADKLLFQPHVSLSRVGSGLQRFLMGLAKKLLLADGLSHLYETLAYADPTAYSITFLWLGAFAEWMSLYLEFSGYADMALGLAACYGIQLPECYGKTVYYYSMRQGSEHWNQSVVQWFYRYIGAHVHGQHTFIHVLGMMLTWGCIGLWYDVSPVTFGFGLWIGLFISLEYLLDKRQTQSGVRLVICTLLCCIGTLLCSITNWSTGLSYLQGMIGMGSIAPTDADGAVLTAYWIVLLVSFYVTTGNWHTLTHKLFAQPKFKPIEVPCRVLAAILLLVLDASILIVMGGTAEMQLVL